MPWTVSMILAPRLPENDQQRGALAVARPERANRFHRIRYLATSFNRQATLVAVAACMNRLVVRADHPGSFQIREAALGGVRLCAAATGHSVRSRDSDEG